MVSIENIKTYTNTGKRSISKETLNLLEKDGYIKSEKFEINNKVVQAYSLDKKGKKKCINMGLRIYNSNSKSHDIMLSQNVFDYAFENNLEIDDYFSEKELEDLDMSSVSKTDGMFYNKDNHIYICIEQISKNYSKSYIQKKRNYAYEINAQYVEFKS